MSLSNGVEQFFMGLSYGAFILKTRLGVVMSTISLYTSGKVLVFISDTCAIQISS